jgi:transcriptional regulator with XRE-family HTH domain
MASLGERLRALRTARGLSLAQLAKRCGCSTSFLSQVERGLSSISIPVLGTVCEALSISLSQFFSMLEADGGEGAVKDPLSSVLRVGEQVGINLSKAAIKYRFLTRDLPLRGFDIVVGEIPSGYVYPPAAHEGEEFGYILEGRLLPRRFDIASRVSGSGIGVGEGAVGADRAASGDPRGRPCH